MFAAVALTRIGRRAATAAVVPRAATTERAQVLLTSIRSLRRPASCRSSLSVHGSSAPNASTATVMVGPPAARTRVHSEDLPSSGAAESLRRFVRVALLVGVPLVAALQWMEQQRDAWFAVAQAEAKQKKDVTATGQVSQNDAATSAPPLHRPSGHVFIATSLDGFISRPDGSIDWLLARDQAGEDHGYDAFMSRIDGVMMGRGTFDAVVAFDPWPYSKPVVVLSKTLASTALPAHLAGRVRVLDLSPQSALDQLSHEGWTRVYIDGGQLIQSCLREGLINDLVITTVPVLIGEGRPLFGAIPGPELDLAHVHTKSFPSGLVQSLYRVRTNEDRSTNKA